MEKNWILIRGLVRGVGHWSDFPEKIKRTFPKDNIELLEIPGNGIFYKEKSPVTILEMVEALRKESHFIRQGKQVHILAISLGAMVATAWANRYPEEIHHLVLINSSSAKHSKFYERLRPENYLKIASLFLGFRTRLTVEQVERKILLMTANSSERRDFALPLWTQESTSHPIEIQNFFRQLLAASSYVFPSRAPAPTTILTCENDRFVNVSCSKSLAKSWTCPIHIHPWAGHDLPLDDPEWVLQQLAMI
ncbi:MAG: alpha/beta fold hydrolase [Pseudobdellovibrionaceae bacterium]